MAADSLTDLAEAIRVGLPGPESGLKPAIEALFGERYHKRHFEKTVPRDAYALASKEEEGGVPFAGLIHPDNPPSGPYGGTSLVWFPTAEGSFIDFGVGTRGLAPDEGILTRPGHRRRIAALRRYLARQGVEAWTKPDPSMLGAEVPKTARDRFSRVVQAFLDLYAYERGWSVMKSHEAEYDALHAALRNDLFASVTADQVNTLLRQRRFVVLQGPPGTGKTRMADEIRRHHFGGRGKTVQFHPAVTYEDFVIGLSPDASERQLRFDVRRGWLLDAIREAGDTPYLLVIDEVNRADLGKVLGEAIYLFEVGEIGGERARTVELPHSVDGKSTLQIPPNLFVIATMNTADRSIASMDLAVRRRFAFVTMLPEREVVAAQKLELATRVFDMVSAVFVEHAPGDALQLLPGHAYFIAATEEQFIERMRYELLPLLDEYLQQGLVGAAAGELHAVRDEIEDVVTSHGRS